MGVPGLAPRPGLNRGIDGSLDEGLGFHQDGTARRAGGVAGTSGPSEQGQRARTYMRSGLQNGLNGNAGLYDDLHYNLWNRDDPTRGGRRNPNSREYGDFDPMNMAIDRGLNYGAGFVNSLGEAALSGLVDGGRARLNFRMDREGYFNGEGDALLPFYDGKFTTVYTQLGARSMHDSDDTRWIGNVGLGQRWFPLARGEDVKSDDYDSGNLMLGYNAFFDYDFTRSHQRGGVGVEAQFDWLRLASNYYFPISNWKGSRDFDSRFVQERPAEGWDVRAKGYLPFYRNVAVTGAYSQWYGDHVGMFGASRLEKDPKVWSYGLEYTPVPLVSGFITQKSTERGRSDTEFGLTFTYHFQMPWEDQISHSKVAELRTVSGSRHEFVDRENKIILEYRAKNAYRIEFLGQDGSNTFRFRIRDGFDEFKPGQTVRVTAGGVTLAAAPAEEKSLCASIGSAIAGFFSVSTAHAADFSQTYTSDGRGEFVVRVSSPTSGPLVLHVQAGDNTQSFTVNVVANTLAIDTASPLPDGVAGSHYSHQLAASGGTSPYSYAVSGGSLPTGLSLSGDTISGTPTANGSFSFEITVTDATSATASKSFSLTVNTSALSIDTDTLPTGSVGITYSQQLAASGGTVPYSFAVSAGSLPSGLSLSGDTISGTPTANGSFSFEITVTDATSATASKSFSLTVSASALSIDTDTLPAGTVGSQYSQQLAASGGTIPYSFAVSAGSLPSGLSLSGDTISGTPTASGPFSFEITVTDATNATASKSFSLTVNTSALTITTDSLPDGTVGSQYSQQLAASGGTVPYSFAVSAGSLPGGLTLDGGGLLSGTPTASGAFSFEITVTDATSATASKSFSLTVNTSALTITTDSLPDGTVGSQYSQQLAASGGTVPYSFTVSAGSLPAGLSLSGDTISGMPTASGAFSFTVTVTDASSPAATADKQFSLTVAAAAPYSLEASPAVLTLNAPQNVTFTLKLGGNPVPAGTSVTFAANANFTGLPTTAQNTNTSGQIEVNNLTATVTGPQTISATVGGETVSVAITVDAAVPVYTLPGAITVATDNSPADGSTANVLRVQVFDSANGVNAGAGVTVTWSVTSPNPATGITLVGGNTSVTDASGMAEKRLTDSGGSARAVTVKAEVDGGGSGKEQSGNVGFAAITYTLAQTPATSIAVGQNVTAMPFTLRVSNGIAVPDGTSVSLAYSGPGAFTTSSGTATVGGGNGSFSLNLTGQTVGDVTVTATWDSGAKSAQCTVTVTPFTYSITFDNPGGYSPSFSGSGTSARASQSVTVTVLNPSAGNAPVAGATVSFSATMSTTNQAVVAARKTQFYGLKIDSANGGSTIVIPNGNTDGNGQITLNLEDVVGERTLRLTASVTPPGGSAASAQATVRFGKGPLQYFKAPDGTTKSWTNSSEERVSGATSFEAAAYCGGDVSPNFPAGTGWTPHGVYYYASRSKLPTVQQLQDVADNGAWIAAGWSDSKYWTAGVYANAMIAFMVDVDGTPSGDMVLGAYPVVCLR